jgi:hypothetical protein
VATNQCGQTQVNWDSAKCSFVCTPWPSGKNYTWVVTCGKGKDIVSVSGTGHEGEGGGKPPKGFGQLIEVAGSLEMLAVALQNDWKRPVKVPSKLKGKVLRTRTVKGTPEEMAKALGLTLGAAR